MTAGWISPRWVPVMIYCVVLAAGVYHGAMSLGGGPWARVAGFAAVMAVLLAIEAAERRWLAPPEPRWAVLALLAARLGLFAGAMALDSSGESRVLFILVPFAAYFTLGRGVRCPPVSGQGSNRISPERNGGNVGTTEKVQSGIQGTSCQESNRQFVADRPGGT